MVVVVVVAAAAAAGAGAAGDDDDDDDDDGIVVVILLLLFLKSVGEVKVDSASQQIKSWGKSCNLHVRYQAIENNGNANHIRSVNVV